MPGLTSWLSAAVCHHRSGDAAAAETLCRKILKLRPDNAATLHFLGVLAAQNGRLQESTLLLSQSIALDPTAECCGALGAVLEQQCRMEAALVAYRQARDLEPLESAGWESLAQALDRMGQFEESSAVWARRVRMEPARSDLLQDLCFHWANALALAGHKEAAREQFRKLTALAPHFIKGWFHLGIIETQLNNTPAAVIAYDKLLALAPTHAKGWNNLGILKQASGDLQPAMDCYQRAIQAEPEFTQALYNFGSVLQLTGRMEEAAAAYEQVLRHEPSNTAALNNYGNTLVQLNRVREAAGIFDQVLEQLPEDPMARYNRGLVRLLLGDLRRGFADYEARLELTPVTQCHSQAPLWTWQPLSGKTILLSAEQGLGDTLQFIRYAALVAGIGAHVVVQCPAPLVKLLETAPGVNLVLANGQTVPPHDFQIPLLSLPQRLQATLDTIPATGPYLFTRRDLTKRDRLKGSPSVRRVGIAWAGNPHHANDKNRSLPASFLDFTGLKGIQFISLQKDLPPPPGLIDARDQMADFAATGDFVSQLDLVISVDTAIAHLAGAMGKPVWILLAFAPDWRWMMDREDSPWYPSARLFRQTKANDWQGVMERVRQSLENWDTAQTE